MNKKQMTAFVNQIIASAIATDVALGDGGPPLTEEEARTFLGMVLKRQAKKLVADTLRVEVADVTWVDVEEKAAKAVDADSADAIADDSDDAIAAA